MQARSSHHLALAIRFVETDVPLQADLTLSSFVFDGILVGGGCIIIHIICLLALAWLFVLLEMVLIVELLVSWEVVLSSWMMTISYTISNQLIPI